MPVGIVDPLQRHAPFAQGLDRLAPLTQLRSAPVLASAFGLLSKAHALVEPMFRGEGEPTPDAQSEAQQRLLAALLPRVEARVTAGSAGSDLLEAAKHGLVEGIQAGWKEALAAGMAAPGGPQAKAIAFVKTLVLRGAKPAWDAFQEKHDALKKAREAAKPSVSPAPARDSTVVEPAAEKPPGVALQSQLPAQGGVIASREVYGARPTAPSDAGQGSPDG